MYLVCRLLLRCPARFTLFPYTTLFRSREVDIAWTAAFVRRNVEIRAGGKIARSRAAIGRKDKQVAARALVPVGPVAVKKVLGDVGLHLVLFFFFIALFVAVVVFAVGIYRRGKRNR